MKNYEKLGSFYLGRHVDADTQTLSEEPVLYPSKDLTTHAVCVGMTGSGKTGLCVALLEEAAIDGIPALIIDPKGDLGNLLLQFPQLRGSDFEPWLEEAQARQKGIDLATLAEQTATTWRNGLEDWDQPSERIERLASTADFTIYTPGSSSGRPISILKSFDAPSVNVLEDASAYRDYIMSAVSSLLALLKINADPLNSREHILLSSILDFHWNQGQNLDLAAIIHEIQQPPFDKVGVFDLETFYPVGDRLKLAMTLNNLLSSPSFGVWTEGEPLNIQRMLYTPEGKPRLCILSIAHLNDTERMFFVTTLLNATLAWMRGQSGTSSLRALIYMDEIFGYFPPTANPPSKLPMLTLLKQARAFGVGVVLATQNPVDLDYKGLANTGTWFIGRLQTDRDKQRVLDGLESASQNTPGAFSRTKMDNLLSGLGSRRFLLHNVHQGEPILMQTRWVMSYLRGPLTLSQIKQLIPPVDQHRLLDDSQSSASSVFSQTATYHPGLQPSDGLSSNTVNTSTTAIPTTKPRLPLGVDEFFLLPKSANHQAGTYHPVLFAQVKLHFVNAKTKVDHWLTAQLFHPACEQAEEIHWRQADYAITDLARFETQPLHSYGFATLPPAFAHAKDFALWTKQLPSYLYQEKTLDILYHSGLKMASLAEETEGDFSTRLTLAMHEKRDFEMEKLRKRYAVKLNRLEERLRKAQDKVEAAEGRHSQQKMSTIISVGSALLGALLGRKKLSASTASKAATAMRGASRTSSTKLSVEQAQESLLAAETKLQEMELTLEDELQRIQDLYEIDNQAFETINIRPRKTDIFISALGVGWFPKV